MIIFVGGKYICIFFFKKRFVISPTKARQANLVGESLVELVGDVGQKDMLMIPMPVDCGESILFLGRPNFPSQQLLLKPTSAIYKIFVILQLSLIYRRLIIITSYCHRFLSIILFFPLLLRKKNQ